MAADKSTRDFGPGFGEGEGDEEQDALGQRAAGAPAAETARTGGRSGTRDREQRAGAAREGMEALGRGSPEDNARLARTTLDLWNERDFDQAVRLAAEDVEFVDVPSNTTRRSLEAYRESMQRWATAFPDGRIEVTRVVADEDGAAVEYVGRGTHTGPFAGPAGSIPATGRRVELTLCDVVEIEQGKARRVRSYYDSATLMRQLGLLSEGGVAGQGTGASTGASTRAP
jgi:steroid delta-isomerase-like uncharacterized protein